MNIHVLGYGIAPDLGFPLTSQSVVVLQISVVRDSTTINKPLPAMLSQIIQTFYLKDKGCIRSVSS